MVVVTVFVVSLLTGGLGIYAGARLVVGSEDHVNTIVTGLLGAVVWVTGGLFLGWIRHARGGRLPRTLENVIR